MTNFFRRRGPSLFLAVIFALVSLASVFASDSTMSLHASGGLDLFLIGLYEQHRILYAVVVTGATALIALLLSIITELIFKLFISDRLR